MACRTKITGQNAGRRAYTTGPAKSIPSPGAFEPLLRSHITVHKYSARLRTYGIFGSRMKRFATGWIEGAERWQD
jgi:hypothetical protein